MIERLANVIYWAACGFAVFAVLVTINLAFENTEEMRDILIAGAMSAAAIWLTGRACLYILVGSSRPK